MPHSSQSPRDSPARRQRRRRTHHRTDSNGELLASRHSRTYDDDDDERQPGSPSKRRPKRSARGDERTRRGPESSYTRTSTTALSSTQLAKLDQLNRKLGWNEHEPIQNPRVRDHDEHTRAEHDAEREREEERERERQRRREERRRRRKEEQRAAELAGGRHDDSSLAYENPKWKARERERSQRRVTSGQRLERGGASAYYSEKETYRDDIRMRRDDGSSDPDTEEAVLKRKKRRKILIGVGVLLLVLIIVISVAVVVSKKNSGSGDSGSADGSGGTPSNANLKGISQDSIPQQYRGTYLDPFTWYDTDGFNVTFTDAMVGGLSIMGLNDTWDDNTRANNNVKPLNQQWSYGTDVFRGMSIGGWLSIEPFITPSLFNAFSAKDNVVDEWTMSQALGPSQAQSTIEKHYSSFLTEQDFIDIQAAGFDHVRISYSYWAVTTYPGDPYVPKISWRYLLRALEWARKYGLRVNLDLHGIPGSQNGWNHSGHQGTIGWLNGTDGALNAQRALDIHKQLATFFSQPRYKNLVTLYGLVNEPRMVELQLQDVLNWTTNAIAVVRGSGYNGQIVFGDGFEGLDKWQGQLPGQKNLMLDVHQYVVFNVDQLVLDHHDKINFACKAWTAQTLRSQNTATGFGPTMFGEWSQADTDCTTYLNNVGVGSRWEGTLNMDTGQGGSASGSVLNPVCPTKNNPPCTCGPANAAPSSYSDAYKQFLLMFAEAQMHSFEQGQGWFYWTWKTESAAQWDYKAGLANGIMPKLAYQRDFNCSQDIPDFSGLPNNY